MSALGRHLLVEFEFLRGIRDICVGNLRDMHQSILFHTDVDESAETGEVRDDARNDHACVDILDAEDAREFKMLDLRPRIEPGLPEFFQDIRHR